MSKYKVGDRVIFPYGSGGEGKIVDVKHVFGIPRYVVLDDWYQSMIVIHCYFGWSLTKIDKALTTNSWSKPR